MAEDQGGGTTTLPRQVGATRFFMRVKLDNTRVIRDLQKYLDEVITHLFTTDEYNLIESIVLNGYRVFLDRSRGKHIDDCIISVYFSKKDFGELYLRNADGKAVVRRINKSVPSDFTAELIHIKPIYDSGNLNVFYVR